MQTGIRRHPWRTSAISLAALFLLLNVWAYRHVRAMTHFTSGGELTIRPEQMSLAGRVAVVLTGVNLPHPVNSRTPGDLGLPFTTHRLTAADGMSLEAWHVPRDESRAIIVLCHGYAGCKSRLLDEARAFRELGCENVLLDFRGSGGSAGETTTLGYQEAADVAAACALARDLAPGRPLILFGRSMGSVAILRAAAHGGDDPTGVILECPFDRLLTTVRHRFTALGLPSFPSAELMVVWGGVQHGMNGFAHNPAEYAARVNCPALVLSGAEDRRVSVGEVEAVYTGLAGEKRLEVFPGVGHESCHRTRPDLWERHVAEFLDRVAN